MVVGIKKSKMALGAFCFINVRSGSGPLIFNSANCWPVSREPEFSLEFSGAGLWAEGRREENLMSLAAEHHTNLDFGSLGAIRRSPCHLQALIDWPGHLLLKVCFIWQGAKESRRKSESSEDYITSTHLLSVYNMPANVHLFCLSFVTRLSTISIAIYGNTGVIILPVFRWAYRCSESDLPTALWLVRKWRWDEGISLRFFYPMWIYMGLLADSPVLSITFHLHE